MYLHTLYVKTYVDNLKYIKFRLNGKVKKTTLVYRTILIRLIFTVLSSI